MSDKSIVPFSDPSGKPQSFDYNGNPIRPCAYYIDAGEQTTYYSIEPELGGIPEYFYACTIVIACSRGQAKSIVCAEYKLDWTTPMTIRKICELDQTWDCGISLDPYLQIQAQAVLFGEVQEGYQFQGRYECGDISLRACAFDESAAPDRWQDIISGGSNE